MITYFPGRLLLYRTCVDRCNVCLTVRWGVRSLLYKYRAIRVKAARQCRMYLVNNVLPELNVVQKSGVETLLFSLVPNRVRDAVLQLRR